MTNRKQAKTLDPVNILSDNNQQPKRLSNKLRGKTQVSRI